MGDQNVLSVLSIIASGIVAIIISIGLWIIKKEGKDNRSWFDSLLTDKIASLSKINDTRFGAIEKTLEGLTKAVDSTRQQMGLLSTKVAEDYTHESDFNELRNEFRVFKDKMNDSLQRVHTQREDGEAKLHEKVNDMKERLTRMETKCVSTHTKEKY